MLVAKYVKVSSRTGTQPFLFTCHVGDRLRVAISGVCGQFAAHWPQRFSRRGILVIRNNLGVRGEGPLYVSAFWELAKSWTFCARPRQAFATPAAEGRRISQKVYLREMRTPRRPAPISDTFVSLPDCAGQVQCGPSSPESKKSRRGTSCERRLGISQETARMRRVASSYQLERLKSTKALRIIALISAGVEVRLVSKRSRRRRSRNSSSPELLASVTPSVKRIRRSPGCK